MQFHSLLQRLLVKKLQLWKLLQLHWDRYIIYLSIGQEKLYKLKNNSKYSLSTMKSIQGTQVERGASKGMTWGGEGGGEQKDTSVL